MIYLLLSSFTGIVFQGVQMSQHPIVHLKHPWGVWLLAHLSLVKLFTIRYKIHTYSTPKYLAVVYNRHFQNTKPETCDLTQAWKIIHFPAIWAKFPFRSSRFPLWISLFFPSKSQNSPKIHKISQEGAFFFLFFFSAVDLCMVINVSLYHITSNGILGHLILGHTLQGYRRYVIQQKFCSVQYVSGLWLEN